MKKAKKVVGAVATVTVFGVFTRLIGFLFKIYLSRVLGAEALGVYQIALSVFFLFSSLSCSGVPLLLSRKTAENNALGENKTFSLFTSALIICTVSSLTLFGLLTLFHSRLTFLFSDAAALPIFLIMIPALVSSSIYCVIRGWLWGEKFFTAFSATETVEEALRILFGVFFLSGLIASLSGVYAIAWAFTVSDVLVAVILFIVFFAKGGKLSKPSDIKDILIPSVPVTAMRVCSGLIGTLIAFLLPLRLVAAGMTSAEATASYGRIAGMAVPLLNAPNAIIGSLCIVLIPELSASMVKKDYVNLNKQLSLGINFSFLISGLFIVVFSSLGREITSFLYADSISGEYLQVATYTMIPVCLTQITQSALNSVGKEYYAFLNYLIGNVVMLSIIYFLPALIGIYSVAAASFVCTGIIGVLNVVSLRKFTKLDAGFLKYALITLIFTVPSALICEWLCSLFAPLLGAFAFIPTGAVGAICYALACFATNVLDVRGVIVGRFRLSKRRT